MWSMVEINVAICCACASALKPIFIRPWRKDSNNETRTGSDRGRGTRRNFDDMEWHFRIKQSARGRGHGPDWFHRLGRDHCGHAQLFAAERPVGVGDFDEGGACRCEGDC